MPPLCVAASRAPRMVLHHSDVFSGLTVRVLRRGRGVRDCFAPSDWLQRLQMMRVLP